MEQSGNNWICFWNPCVVSDFLFDETAIRIAVDKRQMFQLLDSAEALKLDIYPRELIPGELARSYTLELFEGMFIPIASLPDTAIAKLYLDQQRKP